MELEALFGANVRAVRKARRLSQARLAEMIEMSVGAIGQMERGESGPSFATIKKIAAALEVEPSHLFLAEPPLEPLPERARVLHRLNAQLQHMSDAELARVGRVMKAVGE